MAERFSSSPPMVATEATLGAASSLGRSSVDGGRPLKWTAGGTRAGASSLMGGQLAGPGGGGPAGEGDVAWALLLLRLLGRHVGSSGGVVTGYRAGVVGVRQGA